MTKRVFLPLLLASGVSFVPTAHAQQKVLAELFTNTNCGNCRVPEETFESFVNDNKTYGVVRIVYHNEVTNPDDIFYVPAMADVNAREQQYGLSANPLGIIDGYPLGNNESNWESVVKQAATQTLPVTVSITSTDAGNSKFNVHVELAGTTTKQLKLFVALTEDHIIYDNKLAYGNPTSGEWNDIFRAMLPSSTGTDAFTLSGSKSFDFTADATDMDWNAVNMHVVAFVQDVTTSAPSSYQVEGFKKQSLTTAGVVPNSSASYQLGATASGLRLTMPDTRSVQLQFMDVLGREVAEATLRNLHAGEHSIDDLPIGSGIYFVTALVDGKPVATCKVAR